MTCDDLGRRWTRAMSDKTADTLNSQDMDIWSHLLGAKAIRRFARLPQNLININTVLCACIVYAYKWYFLVCFKRIPTA